MSWIFDQQWASLVGGIGLILGVLGLILSALGFVITIYQVHKIKNSTDAASIAIDNLKGRQLSYDIIVESEKILKVLQMCTNGLDQNNKEIVRLHMTDARSRMLKLHVNIVDDKRQKEIDGIVNSFHTYICEIDKDIRGGKMFNKFVELGEIVRSSTSIIERISLAAQKEAYYAR